MTEENEPSGTHIGNYRRHTYKIYPKQIRGKWTATWTLTHPDGTRDEFPARGKFETTKDAIIAASKNAEERVRNLELRVPQ